jgi:hypothetical protein
MGGMVSGAASIFGAADNAYNSSQKGKAGGSGSGSGNNQIAQPSLCGNASMLTDTHNGTSTSSAEEPVAQGNLGSSFGVQPLQNNGALPTTYASGGSAENSSPTLMDDIKQYQKLIDCASPKFTCDKSELLSYKHGAPIGGALNIHQGGFGAGYDDGGKVAPSNTDAVKFVPHSNFFETVGRAILPSVFKAGDQMKSSLNAPGAQAKCNPPQTDSKSTCAPPPDQPKEFHFDKGGLSHYAAAAPKGHHPEFITGKTGYYANGQGTGQSDDIPAMLHDGDYVMDSDVVSALGDGSSKAGRDVLDGFRERIPHKADGGSEKPVAAKIADGEYVFPAAFVTALGSGDNKKGSEILDGLRTKLRQHKRSAPDSKIPPKAKDPVDYIKKEVK